MTRPPPAAANKGTAAPPPVHPVKVSSDPSVHSREDYSARTATPARLLALRDVGNTATASPVAPRAQSAWTCATFLT